MEDHFSHSLCLPLKSKLSRIGLNQRKSRTFNPSWVSLTSTTASFPTIPTSWFPLPASLARVLLGISQLKLVNHSKPSSPLSHPSVTNVQSQVISHATPSWDRFYFYYLSIFAIYDSTVFLFISIILRVYLSSFPFLVYIFLLYKP